MSTPSNIVSATATSPTAADLSGRLRPTFVVLRPDGDPDDRVRLGRKSYRIRFTAKHAEHVMDNFSRPDHAIKHREIQSLLRRSIGFAEGGNVYVCIGKRQDGRIYQTVIEVHADEILVRTCFLCNRRDLTEIYKDHVRNSLS